MNIDTYMLESIFFSWKFSCLICFSNSTEWYSIAKVMLAALNWSPFDCCVFVFATIKLFLNSQYSAQLENCRILLFFGTYLSALRHFIC